jgi:glycosyltransferase involved in cell wall biosynthesis
MAGVVRSYLRKYPFVGIADYLELETGRVRTKDAVGIPREPEPADPRPAAPAPVAVAGGGPPRIPVRIVVPCYNEKHVLPYLSNTLRGVEASLGERYEVGFIFVDDGSADGTGEDLGRIFGDRPNCVVIRHPENRGVSAAILSGIRASDAEVVCSMDCDCTYDPRELASMIPLLVDGVDLVTASPYHPRGGVRNVPPWRLALSRSASALYRLVLRRKLYTYTSCFRVYRRSAVLRCEVREGRFLGIAELVGKLDLAGAGIVEHPAVLEARLLGTSKIKVLRTIVGHLGLLVRLLALRIRGRGARETAGEPRPVAEGARRER